MHRLERPKRRRTTVRAVALLVAVVAAAVVAAASAIGLTGTDGPPAAAARDCAQLVVPAYFNQQSSWARTSGSKPPPANMILDISGVGAGTAAEPQFRASVQAARAAGITVLGYISTVNGQRPLAEDEAEVRHYAAWYGVTSVFLDRVADGPAQLGYYRTLAAYVRQQDPRAQLWLNPGVYPDRSYMSLGGVVMVFEGTYAQYWAAAVPGWARDYPASRFAHTVYATSAADLDSALRLARDRNAGHVYVTDGTGANPYDALPGYWGAEDAAVAASCRGSGDAG
jgi:spherulation-specific family 4 protein